jgi:hypothetical protein
VIGTMADTEIEQRTNRRIDLLYKNLEHASQAYFQAEGVFPLWESAFALIIGQLLIAYFTLDSCKDQRSWMCLLGAFMSFAWFMLVSLNLQNSLHVGDRMQYLQSKLANELKGIATIYAIEFVDPWPCEKQKANWSAWNIFIGKRRDEKWKEALWKARKSTWLYRRLIPFILFCFWAFGLITANHQILLSLRSVFDHLI